MRLDFKKIDVVEFLNELGMMKVRKDGNEVTFSCPFGLHMKGGAISMQIGTTLCHCFGCGFKGNALTFLEKAEELSTKEAIKWLSERWDISDKKDYDNMKNTIQKKLERSEKKRLQIIEPPNYAIPILLFDELADRELDWDALWSHYNNDENIVSLVYMFDRGFSVETLQNWDIGWDAISCMFTIPYFDENSFLIGFKGRGLPDAIPRYKVLGNKPDKEDRYNFDTLDVSQVLFGINKAIDSINKHKNMILCEGELNCIKMHQYGITNTVGISGQYLSDRQIDLIKKYTNRITLIFDEWDRGVEYAEQLRPFVSVQVVPEHDKDPADMTEGEITFLLLNSMSGILVK